MATRQVQELRDLLYDESLRRLSLFSLQRRRLRGDLISVYRIMRGFDNLPVADSSNLVLDPGDRLRGHLFTIKKTAAATSPRASSFTVRIVNDWNRLLQEVVLADSVASFKLRLDAAWRALFPDMPALLFHQSPSPKGHSTKSDVCPPPALFRQLLLITSTPFTLPPRTYLSIILAFSTAAARLALRTRVKYFFIIATLVAPGPSIIDYY